MDRLEGIKIFVRVVKQGAFRLSLASLEQGSRRSASRLPRSRNISVRSFLCAPPPSLKTDRGRARLLNPPCGSSAISRQRNPASAQARPPRLAWCAHPLPRPASLTAMSCRSPPRFRALSRLSSKCWSPGGRAISSKKASTLPSQWPLRTLALSRKVGEFAVIAVTSQTTRRRNPRWRSRPPAA